ncbi:hypothetical protein IFM89_031020 [Coptis chinensis]|uniref:FAF domain-containing protein n=1 Tax=Coptis chinensis TaxID=261450 RepID=A0A835HCM1_9MAGN|nr:hypothetical protein IFM89_031020 [Coptis chinensis]
MASCDHSLQQLFENPMPENATFIESLTTWNHIKSRQAMEISSFSEIFGELHFKESLESSSLPFLPPFPLSSPLSDLNPQPEIDKSTDQEYNKSPSSHPLFSAQKNKKMDCSKKRDDFSPRNSGSLQMCTEGLGFESFEDVDESDKEEGDDVKKPKEKVSIMRRSSSQSSHSEYRKRNFPPPIPSIGRNGKPWVCYKSFRQDGRLVLKEMMIPTQGQEFMHACREHGRLTLHLVHADEEISADAAEVKDNEGEAEEDGDDAEEQVVK